jgi:hypothetical protein
MCMSILKFFIAQSQKIFYEQLFLNCAYILKKVFEFLKSQNFEPRSLERHVYFS